MGPTFPFLSHKSEKETDLILDTVGYLCGTMAMALVEFNLYNMRLKRIQSVTELQKYWVITVSWLITKVLQSDWAGG